MRSSDRTGAPGSRQTGRTGTDGVPSLRILHVEDDPSDALLVRTLLDASTAASYDITQVGTLQEALGIAVGGPSAVLLDLDLPDSRGLGTLDGFQAAAPGLPVIVLTGQRDRGLGLAALGRGAHGFLVKDDATVESLEMALTHGMERARIQVAMGPVGRTGGLTVKPVADDGSANERTSILHELASRGDVVLVSCEHTYEEDVAAFESHGIPVARVHVVDTSGRGPALPKRFLGGYRTDGPDALEEIAVAVEDGCQGRARGCHVLIDNIDAIVAHNPAPLPRDFIAAVSNRLHVIGVQGTVLARDVELARAIFAEAAPLLVGRAE